MPPLADKIFWFSDLFPIEFKVSQKGPDIERACDSTWPIDPKGEEMEP